eukprot:5133171-Karenia_brevis.AAC.1
MGKGGQGKGQQNGQQGWQKPYWYQHRPAPYYMFPPAAPAAAASPIPSMSQGFQTVISDVKTLGNTSGTAVTEEKLEGIVEKVINKKSRAETTRVDAVATDVKNPTTLNQQSFDDMLSKSKL